MFFRQFLRRIGVDLDRSDPDPNRYDLGKLRAIIREDATRYIVTSQRRIDITIDFGDARIGIENKPWAGEQPDQLKDYAAHLAKRYQGNFQLVYLAGDGTTPQTSPEQQQEDLSKKRRFVVWTYRLDLQPRIEFCAKECEAENVRWFLQDFAAYMAETGTGVASPPMGEP